MFHTLTSNIHTLKANNLQAKDAEIGVAVLTSDLENGVETPVFYATRYGMLYNPNDEFKPNVQPNHKIKGLHVESYYQQLPDARKEYKRLLEKFQSAENSGEIKQLINDLKMELNEKNNQVESMRIRINEQTNMIQDLNAKAKNSGENSQVEKLEKMIQTLAEMQNNRIEIKIGEKATKIIEKVVHEEFSNILTLIAENEAVYLYGAAGTGKSQIAEDIAKALEMEFYPASTITQEFKLTGYMDANGIYRETNFYKAMEYGGLFFLDEMDSCSSDVLVGINGALANGYFDFPHKTVYAHKDFRVIAAGNTIGRGGNMAYTGRQALDISTLDRFLALEIDYSPAIDKTVANGDMELVEFAQAVRKAAKENEIIILMSYRSIGKITKLQKTFDIVKVLQMAFIKGIAEDDIRMLWRNMSIDSSNKYYKALKQAA